MNKGNSRISGFDSPVAGVVRAKTGVALTRIPKVDVEIESTELECSAEGLRVVSVKNGMYRIGKWETEDWTNSGVPCDKVALDFPISVKMGCVLRFDVYNPTDEPIHIRWTIKIKKILFAVAIERISDDAISTDMIYCHALTPAAATAKVISHEQREVGKGVRIRHVATSKVIGYHVEDKEGKILSVD